MFSAEETRILIIPWKVRGLRCFFKLSTCSPSPPSTIMACKKRTKQPSHFHPRLFSSPLEGLTYCAARVQYLSPCCADKELRVEKVVHWLNSAHLSQKELYFVPLQSKEHPRILSRQQPRSLSTSPQPNNELISRRNGSDNVVNPSEIDHIPTQPP